MSEQPGDEQRSTSSSNYIAMLQGMPIFGGLRAATLAAILHSAPTRQVDSGEYFYRAGDAGECLYVLCQGGAVVLKPHDGKDYVLRELSVGDCFGEVSFIDLQPRSASVKAIQGSLVLVITHEIFHTIYQLDPEQFALIYMNIARELCRRLRDADERLFRVRLVRES